MHITYLNFFPQSPPGYSRKALASKKKTDPNMPPGGRASKRVRAPEGSELEPPRAQLDHQKGFNWQREMGSLQRKAMELLWGKAMELVHSKVMELVVRTLQLQRMTMELSRHDTC